MKYFFAIFLFVFSLSSCETLMLALSDEKAATFEVSGDRAYVNGVLGNKAYKAFKKMMKKNPGVKTLVLQQVPGSMNDEANIPMCTELRKRNMNTELEANSVIASGGVDLFIAGVKRTAKPGAKIGVHSWRDGKKDGKEYPADHEGHKIFLDYFKIIKRSPDFYWFTLEAAPAEDIHWMTRKEIDQYKLVTVWGK